MPGRVPFLLAAMAIVAMLSAEAVADPSAGTSTAPAGPCDAAPAQDEPSITFSKAAATGLAEILRQRRLTLEQRQGRPLRGHEWWLWGLSAFDYDGDGDLDLIVCIHGSTNGLIIRNLWKETGRMTFEDATAALGVDGRVPSTDNYPLVWDFDGDGDLDIAGLLDDRPTPCLLNEGGERFVEAPFTFHPINYPHVVADLNGDGHLDIAQTRRGKRIAFTYDPNQGTFTKRESDASPPATLPAKVPAKVESELAALRAQKHNRFIRIAPLDAGDVNGDGRPDVVLRAFGSYAGDRRGWYLLRHADGELTDATEALGLPREGAPLKLLDVDDDGDVDLLIASGKRGGLYLNDGRGGFTFKPGPLTDFIKARCPYLHVVFTADFDNDGDLDLAISNRRHGRQKVFENAGAGRFKVALDVRGWDADPLVLCDLNDDGRMDVIVGGADGKESVGVFLNTTADAGGACKLYPRMQKPNVNAVGARLEVFRAGELKAGARPWRTAIAPTDGSPVHLGLGDAPSFDLRITFPGHEPRVWRNVRAAPKLKLSPNHPPAAMDP